MRRLFSRAALLLLTMMLTVTTAWAGNIADCELRGKMEGFEDGYGLYNSLTANVQVWYGDTQLEYNTDYDIEVEYVESYEVGQTYNATVVGMGDWSGTKAFTFTFIEPYHTVVFVANGGTGTMADDIVANNSGYAGHYYLPECGFTAPSCLVFDHWEVSYEGITEDPIKQPGEYFTAPYIYQPSDIQTITVTAHWRVADELPAVNYIDADGEQATKQPGEYTVLTGGGATTLGAGWYVATGIINYTGSVTYGGNVHIILIDGCTMNVGTSGVRINDYGIKSNGSTNLTIYGQSAGSGALSVYTTGTFKNGISAAYLTINGGTVSVTGTGGSTYGLYASQNFTINGGSVNATTTNKAIYVRNGTITLGWNKPTDRLSITASSYSGTISVKDGQALVDGDGNILSGTLAASAINGKTLSPVLIIVDAADNTTAIDNFNGKEFAAVQLSGRTLYKDGKWNTLCLPFALTAAQVTAQLAPDALMTLGSSSFSGGTLTMNLTDATEITAGVPYIIKWNSGSNITNPEFTGVTVSNTTANVSTDDVDFIGTYSPVVIYEEGDKHNLYLGTDNTLYYPTTEGYKVNACRAYFRLKGNLTAGEPASPKQANVRAFTLNFGEGDASGIVSVSKEAGSEGVADAWYTLDGRRLSGKPTAKGLYIYGSKKVMIK